MLLFWKWRSDFCFLPLLLISLSDKKDQSHCFLHFEWQERPIPPKVWDSLKKAGWQKKITRKRIPPRTEGIETNQRFADQFTKLHLWNLVEYDLVMYMDSDIFLLRSMVPCISSVLLSPKKKIAAVRDIDEFKDYFNMGMFVISPSKEEFDSLMCKLHAKNCTGATEFHFAEPWMEQGLLNAAYANQWTEIPSTCCMNLALWQSKFRENAWRPNASRISAIHYTMIKPWDWFCPFTEHAPMCYLFWNERSMRFHARI